MKAKEPGGEATLDVDAHLVETDKEGAQYCYEGHKAFQAKELAGRGLAPQELAEALGFRSPWAAKKLAQQAESYSYQRLGAIYRRLVDEDLALKTGRRPPELGLDLLVVELCGK